MVSINQAKHLTLLRLNLFQRTTVLLSKQIFYLPQQFTTRIVSAAFLHLILSICKKDLIQYMIDISICNDDVYQSWILDCKMFSILSRVSVSNIRTHDNESDGCDSDDFFYSTILNILRLSWVSVRQHLTLQSHSCLRESYYYCVRR